MNPHFCRSQQPIGWLLLRQRPIVDFVSFGSEIIPTLKTRISAKGPERGIEKDSPWSWKLFDEFHLRVLCSPGSPGPVCSFLLLVLKEQLQELQAALLASILDMEEYKKASSSSSGPTSPLEWTDGLLLLHSCPPPLDQHLLGLLGHSVVRLLPPPLPSFLPSFPRQALSPFASSASFACFVFLLSSPCPS